MKPTPKKINSQYFRDWVAITRCAFRSFIVSLYTVLYFHAIVYSKGGIFFVRVYWYMNKLTLTDVVKTLTLSPSFIVATIISKWRSPEFSNQLSNIINPYLSAPPVKIKPSLRARHKIGFSCCSITRSSRLLFTSHTRIVQS